MPQDPPRIVKRWDDDVDAIFNHHVSKTMTAIFVSKNQYSNLLPMVPHPHPWIGWAYLLEMVHSDFVFLFCIKKWMSGTVMAGQLAPPGIKHHRACQQDICWWFLHSDTSCEQSAHIVVLSEKRSFRRCSPWHLFVDKAKSPLAAPWCCRVEWIGGLANSTCYERSSCNMWLE
jgi:hypothetical protein